MTNNPFDSSKDADTLALIGMVASNSGCRPSSLFEWNEPEDWAGRLMFDIQAISKYKEKVKMEIK